MLPLARLSFYNCDSPQQREREIHLARIAGELRGSLPPPTRLALADCLKGINCYYSNLIEGQSTRPIDTERALQTALKQKPPGKAGDLAVLAVAHIETQQWMRAALAENHALDPTSTEFIRELHRRFVSRLPKTLRIVKGDDGTELINEPGRIRTHEVKVGTHVAPAHGDVPSLLDAFQKGWQLLPKTPAHALLAHHRFAWIHPFLDGNGRIARLLTDAMLIRIGLDADGIWSLSRGLAKRRDDYYGALANADAERQGTYDGRGLLSAKASRDFVHFMHDISEDQIGFMIERLSVDRLQERIDWFCQERKTVLKRSSMAAVLLKEAIFMGRIARGSTPTLLGVSDRTARLIVAECMEDGLLVSASHRSDLHPRFPVYAAAYLFPHLFEVDDPQAAMLETLSPETRGVRTKKR